MSTTRGAELVIRLIVAIVVAAVVVWLLGDVAHLRDIIVGLLALLAFVGVLLVRVP